MTSGGNYGPGHLVYEVIKKEEDKIVREGVVDLVQ